MSQLQGTAAVRVLHQARAPKTASWPSSGGALAGRRSPEFASPRARRLGSSRTRRSCVRCSSPSCRRSRPRTTGASSIATSRPRTCSSLQTRMVAACGSSTSGSPSSFGRRPSPRPRSSPARRATSRPKSGREGSSNAGTGVDVYALGVAIFRTLAGTRLPFEGDPDPVDARRPRRETAEPARIPPRSLAGRRCVGELVGARHPPSGPLPARVHGPLARHHGLLLRVTQRVEGRGHHSVHRSGCPRSQQILAFFVLDATARQRAHQLLWCARHVVESAMGAPHCLARSAYRGACAGCRLRRRGGHAANPG